jgi:hypothetical protein
MADANAFIDQLGADLSATYVPAVEAFVQDVGKAIAVSAGPKLGQFVEQLVAETFAQQSEPIREFLSRLTRDVAARYHPSLKGTLTARVVDNGIEIASTDTHLEVSNRATGEAIASLDVPVLVKIRLDDFFVKVDSATVKVQDPQLG